MRLYSLYGGLDAMQEVIGTGKSLVVVQPDFAEELLCLRSKCARPRSASLGRGVGGSVAIRDKTMGLMVV